MMRAKRRRRIRLDLRPGGEEAFMRHVSRVLLSPLYFKSMGKGAMDDCISHVRSVTGVDGGLGYGGGISRYPIIMHYTCSQDFGVYLRWLVFLVSEVW